METSSVFKIGEHTDLYRASQYNDCFINHSSMEEMKKMPIEAGWATIEAEWVTIEAGVSDLMHEHLLPMSADSNCSPPPSVRHPLLFLSYLRAQH
jgi:hypothetical protein